MSDHTVKRTRAGGAVCTACPLLCADIDLPAATRACVHGRAALLAPAAPCSPTHDGRPLAPEAARAAAARLLIGARRVLVTGLGEATLGALAAAGDIAEALGAAIDGGDPAVAITTGPTIARSGEVTAAYDESRDRADLVVAWFIDPDASHPRFRERFLSPRAPVIHVGPSPAGWPCAEIMIPAADEVAAARWLTAHARGKPTVSALAPRLAPLAAALDAAACVGIVMAEPAADGSGVAEWALAEWIRAEAHRRPAFALPLPGGIGMASGNAAGLAAFSTWRYGAPGAIGRADRRGGPFLPAEADALRLIGRGEIDAVLVVGRPRPAIAAALLAAGDRIGCVQVGAETVIPRGIHLPAAGPLDDPGEMLRGDGQLVRIAGRHPAPEVLRLETVLRRLLTALPSAAEARR